MEDTNVKNWNNIPIKQSFLLRFAFEFFSEVENFKKTFKKF